MYRLKCCTPRITNLLKPNAFHYIIGGYIHTSEIRGREDYFAKDYEIPTDPKTLSIDTGKLTIKESTDEIFNVYRKMATVA